MTKAKPENKKEPRVGFKAFDKDMKCRGFQYEAGKTYEMEGDPTVCGIGFHFCEFPLAVLDYYDLIGSRFAEIVAHGKTAVDGDKSATAKIEIRKEISISDMIKAHVALVFTFCFEKKTGIKKLIRNAEKWAKIGSSGYGAQIGSSGDGAKIGSSGDGAKIGSSGDGAQIGSSGDGAKIGSSGDGAQIGSDGLRSVASGIGHDSTAKAKNGSWIVLAEWKWVGENWTPVCVKAGQIGQDGLKEDTYYKLVGGAFVEVAA